MPACLHAEALTTLDTRTPLAQKSSNTYAIVTSFKHTKACTTVLACHCMHDARNYTKGKQCEGQHKQQPRDNNASNSAREKNASNNPGTTGQTMTKQAAYLSPRLKQSCPEMPLLVCCLEAVDPNQGQGGHPHQPQGSHAVHLLYLSNEEASNC